MARSNGKVFNRDVILTDSARLLKQSGNSLLEVVDADGNVDVPITTTDLTTSGNTTLGDASSDALTINAGVTATTGIGSSVSGLFTPFIPLGVAQALSGAGAVNLTTYCTKVTNTGADALTLADSTVKGQLKKVTMIVDPGTDSTLTFNTNATLVFADVGDTAELVWDGSDWIPIATYNTASGDTGPAYTPAS